MRTRDDLGGNLTPSYTGKSLTAGELRPRPASTRALVLVLGWLVPGAGHLLLGKMGRGLLLMVLIVGSFFFGLVLHGKLYSPTVADPPSALHYDLISILWSFAQLGGGLCYGVAHVLGLGVKAMPQSPTYEYGNTFMFLAGLLNYLVVLDAFDIAAGRRP